MKIELFNHLGRTITGRSNATVIKELLPDNLSKEEPLILNLNGVEIITQSFINETLKIVYDKYGFLNVDFQDIPKELEKIVNSEYERVSKKITPSIEKEEHA